VRGQTEAGLLGREPGTQRRMLGGPMPRKENVVVQPLGWAHPRGYANGIVAEGRMLFVAGQVGWDPANPANVKRRFPKTFAAQFDQALANVLEVVRAAGGRPENLARVTLYVTDRDEYNDALKTIGQSWRHRVGRHYPAMTLIVVKELLEPAAKVEIEATAVL
jgi:enamine deaminase RidA (YjgF/YER057c/UK114 family)